MKLYKIPNENDDTRIFHTFDKWECHKAGFYKNIKDGWTNEECELEYIIILTDENLFRSSLKRVIEEWNNSCEHYLTNKSMNRIAWLGQASVCIASGIPSSYSGAWFKLSKDQQDKANSIALEYLNEWLKKNSRDDVSLDDALCTGRQIELY